MKSLCEMELQRISPATATCAPAQSSPAAAFDRETAVFTRVDGGLDPSKIHVPDSFFEFTSQDLKASTSMSGVHLTRTMKEAMKPKFKFALIRVRFTDGYILQGKFRAGEKVDAIKAWVDGCLNTPDRLYTLSTMPPVRKVTGKDLAGKTLNELGLAPGQYQEKTQIFPGTRVHLSTHEFVGTGARRGMCTCVNQSINQSINHHA
jgi:hypothetical protein